MVSSFRFFKIRFLFIFFIFLSLTFFFFPSLPFRFSFSVRISGGVFILLYFVLLIRSFTNLFLFSFLLLGLVQVFVRFRWVFFVSFVLFLFFFIRSFTNLSFFSSFIN